MFLKQARYALIDTTPSHADVDSPGNGIGSEAGQVWAVSFATLSGSVAAGSLGLVPSAGSPSGSSAGGCCDRIH